MVRASKRICRRAPPTTMYDLNDDVLREVFSHLDLEVLNVMADVCSTFRQVAKVELVSRHKTVNLVIYVDDNCQETEDGTLYVKKPQWIPFLRRFGNGIPSIITREHMPLEPIVKYCSESLMELALGEVEWTYDMILEFRPILSRLRVLHLKGGSICIDRGAHEFFSFCDELNSLSMDGMHEMCFESPIALPKLKTLDLNFTFFDATALKCSIKLNPQLKEIKLPSHSPFTCEMIKMVGRYVPNVEVLAFRYQKELIVNWKKFKNLKSLDIILDNVQTIRTLRAVARAAIPLEHLRMRTNAQVTKFVKQMLKFKSLRELDLLHDTKLPLQDVMTIVRNLPDLRKLILRNEYLRITGIPEIIKCGPKLQTLAYHVKKRSMLDNDSYGDIKNAVVNYSKCRQFRLYFVNYDYNILSNSGIPEKLLLANASTLKIEWKLSV